MKHKKYKQLKRKVRTFPTYSHFIISLENFLKKYPNTIPQGLYKYNL